MRKHDELLYGCMARAGDKEMTFVLLSRDDAAPSVIAFWAHERVRLGKNKWGDAQIVEALECASKMLLERGEYKP